MNISQINGREFKRALKARRCAFRYHNKNTRGGNFGFEIRGVKGIDFELSGHYSINGDMIDLRLGGLYQPGASVNNMTLEKLQELILNLSDIRNTNEKKV